MCNAGCRWVVADVEAETRVSNTNPVLTLMLSVTSCKTYSPAANRANSGIKQNIASENGALVLSEPRKKMNEIRHIVRLYMALPEL